jgi:hypothetical protein
MYERLFALAALTLLMVLVLPKGTCFADSGATSGRSFVVASARGVTGGKKSLRQIKAMAIRISMRYLPRLKPYTRDYPKLVGAVRAYWHVNAARPSASRLTDLVMRYVKSEYRALVRPRLLSGAREGIAKLKQEMRN